MPSTLLLAVDTWDLITDANGNIALADSPYSLAQDVASAVRLWAGELWYDTTQGIPYLDTVLGKYPPVAYVKAQVEKAALTVPTVIAARCVIVSFKNRVLTGQIQVTNNQGVVENVGF